MNKINIINEESYQEAERLIEQARVTGAKQLDLSSLRIVDLPASLGQLHWLELLDLSNCYWLEDLSVLENLAGLQSLNLSKCKQLADLKGLENLSRLQSLNLSWCDQLTDLKGLENLTGLQSLDLPGCDQLTDLKGLKNLTGLQSLDLSWCDQLTDLKGLKNLTGLQSLDLSWCDQLTDLKGLENLTGLQSLDLSWCDQLTDLKGLENLTGLQSLDLPGCDQLTDLKGLENLSRLQSLDLSGCDQLTDLKGLENLTGLQSLDLPGCDQLTDLKGLENLSRLQSLDLSGWDQLTDLKGLENLSRLQSLDLSGWDQLTDLKGLKNLTGLQSLDLSGWDQLTDLKGLENLSRLQSLDLSGCDQLTDLKGLKNLTGLQSLDLPGCDQLTDLKGLENLSRLQSLDLSGCDQLTDLKGLENLSRLQSLDLSGCDQLTDLKGLKNLTGLQSLDLSGCDQLTDLKGLENLSRLQSLDLSECDQLTDLKGLENLSGLQSLDLSGCDQLTDLKGLENLSGLQSLDLSGCDQLTDLKGLENLSGLQSLSLSGCDQLTDLKGLEKLIHLKKISISRINHAAWLYHFPRLVDVNNDASNLAIDNVPAELLSNSVNALIPITAWQRDLLASKSAPNSELKLFILGNGGIGKTQISRRLQGFEYDPAVSSTHGIHLGRFRILEADDHASEIYLNLWDFGGQDVYLSTHGLFLDERAIYVVAWHPEFENQDEYQQNGVPMRNRLLGYWLAYIRSLAGADAPVIVVQTRCDEADTETTAPLPQDHGFNYLKTTGCSALQDYGLERLLPEIRHAGRLLRKRYATVEIPQSWVDLEQDLRKLRDGGQKTLAFEAFESQCQQRNQLAPPTLIANFLHRAGQVFWRQGAFGNDLVLKQDWALAGIYAILERNTVLPQIRRDGGVFHLTQLQNAVWRDFNEQEQRMFIDMMVQCNACFALGDDVYVATELLPDEQDMASLIQSTWRNATADAHVRLAYDFLHEGIIKQVLREIGGKAKREAKYWRTGVCYYDCQAESAVMIRAMFDPEQHDSQRGYIEVLVAGKQAQHLAEHLTGSIESIRIGGKPKVEWLRGQHIQEAHEADTRSAFADVAPAALPVDDEMSLIPASLQIILVIGTEWDSRHGGLSTFNRELCMALAQLGKTVYCLVEDATTDEEERAKAEKVTLIHATGGNLSRKITLPADPDLIIGHGRITGGAAKSQQEDFFPQAKRIHFIHMSPSQIEWHKGKADAAQQAEAREQEELNLAKAAQLVIAVGPMLFRESVTLIHRLAPESRPVVCQFNPGFRQRDRQEKTKPLNLQCLLVGRAEDEALKGIDIAVKALHRIVEAHEPLEYKPELIIRGAPTGEGTALNTKIKEEHSGFHVQVREYNGNQETITGDYRSAALFLMPSRSEGFGLVPLEALSVGMPILISENSGLAELLKSHLETHKHRHYIVATPDDTDQAVQNWKQSITTQLIDIEAAIRRAKELAEILEDKLKWTDSCRKMLEELR